jgi:hypothetical protein
MNISELELQHSDSPIQAIERATSILRSVGIDSHQLAIWLLRQHSKFDAVHANIYEDACELVERLTNQSKLQDPAPVQAKVTLATLTATQLGQMLAAQSTGITQPPSAQQINQALEQLNFHIRVKKIWQITELGKQYGRLVNVTDEQEKTRLQVRWLPIVLDRLAPLFTVSC